MFNHEPLVQQSWDQIPRLSSRETFAAQDAKSWQSAMLVDHNRRWLTADSTNLFASSIMSDQTPQYIMHEVLDSFELYVLLQRLSSIVSLRQKTHAMVECPKILLAWLERYRETPAFKQQEDGLMMLWHSIHVSLYCDVDTLEIAAGRDGVIAVQRVEGAARTWACSLDARHCILHSLLLQQHFERVALEPVAPTYALGALYRCGIMWYCYAQFGPGDQPLTESQLQNCEIQMNNIDLDSILTEEIRMMVMKQPKTFLLQTANSLRRMGHWRVAGRLATTLFALIDQSFGLC